jgi:alpha-2-macroglobulin
MAYALALHSPQERRWADAARAGNLSAHGQAKLGLAYLAIGDGARAVALAAELERSAKQDAQQAWWENDRDGFMDYYYDTSPETTAAAIKLIAKINPKSPLLPKAVQWLVSHRSDGYYWHSTKQTAIAIDGLTEYLRVSGELKPDYRVAVEVNGRSLLERSFSEADATSPVAPKIRVPAGVQNTVRITQTGNGRLYWSAKADWFSTEEKQEKTGSARLNLLRDYFRLVPVQQGDRTVYRLAPLTGPVKSGDLLASRLTVTGANWRYLLIEDPIPAGVETVEKDNLYELEEAPAWWRSWYDRRELRDDRVAIFKTYFSEGQSQFFYLFKVVNPGKFQTSPARVQPMYQPDYQATSESKTFEVTAQ